jgi:hypothetical protein
MCRHFDVTWNLLFHSGIWEEKLETKQGHGVAAEDQAIARVVRFPGAGATARGFVPSRTNPAHLTENIRFLNNFSCLTRECVIIVRITYPSCAKSRWLWIHLSHVQVFLYRCRSSLRTRNMRVCEFVCVVVWVSAWVQILQLVLEELRLKKNLRNWEPEKIRHCLLKLHIRSTRADLWSHLVLDNSPFVKKKKTELSRNAEIVKPACKLAYTVLPICEFVCNWSTPSVPKYLSLSLSEK